MILCIAGSTVGLLLGLAQGGRPRQVMRWSLRWLPGGGLALMWLLATRFGVGSSSGIVVAAALLALVAVAVANRHLAGLGVVAVGLAANLVPVVVDGGTPVDLRALEAVHGEGPRTLAPSQHLADDTTVAAGLGSRIPLHLPLRPAVVSFGDLIVAVGLAAAGRNLVLGPRRRGIPVSEVLAGGPLTIDVSVPGRQPVLDLTRTARAVAARSDDRGAAQHPVDVAPGQPVPVPLGWERADDEGPDLRPRRRRTRTHPTMRLAHR